MPIASSMYFATYWYCNDIDRQEWSHKPHYYAHLQLQSMMTIIPASELNTPTMTGLCYDIQRKAWLPAVCSDEVV